jgi:hypothetical protein
LYRNERNSTESLLACISKIGGKMNAVESNDTLQVGELKFIRDDEIVSKCDVACDCADPGTGGDDCSCEDS